MSLLLANHYIYDFLLGMEWVCDITPQLQLRPLSRCVACSIRCWGPATMLMTRSMEVVPISTRLLLNLTKCELGAVKIQRLRTGGELRGICGLGFWLILLYLTVYTSTQYTISYTGIIKNCNNICTIYLGKQQLTSTIKTNTTTLNNIIIIILIERLTDQ